VSNNKKNPKRQLKSNLFLSNITMAISYFICHNMGFVFFRNRRQFVTEKKTIKFLKDPRSKLAFDKYFFLKCQVRRPKRGDGGNRKTTNCASPPTPPRKKNKAVNSSGQGRQEDLDQPLSSVRRWNPRQKAHEERHRVALG
jgi:hypothetical protein